MNNQERITFNFCNFKDNFHRLKLVELISHYMSDPMGGSASLTSLQEEELVSGLAQNSSAFVLFILVNDEIKGLATCFVNFSTFKAKPYINVHDVVILKEFRGKGLGKKLMEEIIEIAKERKYCKITLEVLDNNINAKKLYQSLGFTDSDPVMHFWTKLL
jgi:ribosomal protein S18 acetylase RimI-like enzyme